MYVFKILTYAFTLIGKLLILSPRIFYNRRRGIRAFKMELLNMGLTKDEVNKLSKTYALTLKITEFIPGSEKDDLQ